MDFEAFAEQTFGIILCFGHRFNKSKSHYAEWNAVNATLQPVRATEETTEPHP